MITPTPQPWTAETVRLIRSVLNMHVDEILPKSAGSWRAVCSCGEFTEEVRDAAQLSHTSWSTHRAAAVLAALHEAGLLRSLPPIPPSPGHNTASVATTAEVDHA